MSAPRMGRKARLAKLQKPRSATTMSPRRRMRRSRAKRRASLVFHLPWAARRSAPLPRQKMPTMLMSGKPQPGFWEPGWCHSRWLSCVSGAVTEVPSTTSTRLPWQPGRVGAAVASWSAARHQRLRSQLQGRRARAAQKALLQGLRQLRWRRFHHAWMERWLSRQEEPGWKTMFRQAQKTSVSGSQRRRLRGREASSWSASMGSQARARLSRLCRSLASASRSRTARMGASCGRKAGKSDWRVEIQHVHTQRAACHIYKCLSAFVLRLI